MKFRSQIFGFISGLTIGWVLVRLLWAFQQISNKNVPQILADHTNRAPKGVQYQETEETEHYTRIHAIENGIERISYLPKKRRQETPIVFQHGMWHGAWCWHLWQELLAEWGWESHAHSLPGHANSHTQRDIRRCTLDYYLGFLEAEIGRFPQKPILIGHSMGGALTQWYLKYVGDLKAAVLVAPWLSHYTVSPATMLRILKVDWQATFLPFLTAKAEFCRSPQRAANFLLGENSVYSPEELYARLSDESVLVLLQHNPPFWHPPAHVNTPLLWLAGELDAALSVEDERQSAAYYRADFHIIERAGHNLMMAHNFGETAERIHNWLVDQELE